MTALIAWGATSLLASTALMLLVLAIRAPVRRWAGPRLGYALWALPAVRMILPALPADLLARLPLAGAATTRMSVLFVGPATTSTAVSPLPSLDTAILLVWLAGATGLFALYTARHVAFCRRLRAAGTDFGRAGSIRVIATDVDGPLAFGVFRRCIAVPRDFARDYDAHERDLALAHERAHHARGDLIAGWAALALLAAHWWNPVAWLAARAFREDQEFAADAHVLAARTPAARADYAAVLAKAAGVGALPACNLNARSTLKGRLIMLTHTPRSPRRLAAGTGLLILLGGAALAGTAATGAAVSTAGKQAVTIGIKPDGSGSYRLIVGKTAVAPGAPLPGGATLPADFDPAGGCSLKPDAKPRAMAIKGSGAILTYTVMCASAAPAPVAATLTEGLASLNTMRASVATQPASAAFPETERTHALGAIDRSIAEVTATLATIG